MNRFAPVFLAMLFCAAAVSAADYSDLYIVPIAGHTQGANGTSWRTDIVLHNPQDVAIRVEMALIDSGRPSSSEAVAIALDDEPSLQLAPGETRTIHDVLGQQGRDVLGALLLGADLPFVATTRTWAESPDGRTLGQTVLPIAIRGGAAGGDDVTVLPGLTQNGAHRSNFGLLVAASRAPFLVEITFVSPGGDPLGSEVVVLDAAGFAHQQFGVNAAGIDDVTAIVRIVEGDGIVVPYASIIDNVTAEATFVAGGAMTNGAGARAMLRAAVAQR